MRFGKAVVAIALAASGGIYAARHASLVMRAGTVREDGAVILPNGWAIKPAGHEIPLSGDMPLQMAVTPDGTKLLVVTGGWHDQGLSVVDLAKGEAQFVPTGDAWAGLALVGTTAYVSGGPLPIRSVRLGETAARGTDLDLDAKESAKSRRYTAGVAACNGSLWVARTERDFVQRVNPESGAVLGETQVGYRPYGLAVSPDGKTLAVSNWGGQSVSLLDTSDGHEIARVRVEEHPNQMAYAPDGRLFVADANSDAVSVIRGAAVVETIRTSLDPKAPAGSTPDAVAVTPDGKTLFVANADNNDVAMVDISKPESRVRGFIPTGWYPSALAVSPDGRKLYVGTAKGLGFGPNTPAKGKFPRKEMDGKRRYDYIPSLLAGHVAVVNVPTEAQLAAYTRQVALSMPTGGLLQPTGAEADAVRGIRRLKHVIYVIRENRTYDQVFGDLEKANGDKSLVLFGEEVTPNAHRLAREFVTLDNLYCNGEVSEDGHQWCDSAYANDYVERAWTLNYSGRGEPKGDARLSDSPGGYLWDNCRKHGKSFYSYGEYSSFSSNQNAPPRFTGTKGLKGHASLGWSKYELGDDFGRDYVKIDVFLRDFKASEAKGDWPDFVVMSLGEDHTSGLRPGKFTPQASVASNDLALGRLVEAVSHSRYWKDTAIFVIEDDAQNGPDHVDAHRTAGLVISPYTRRGVVDSTMYSTASYVRTMEMILGLPPMTQYDQRATPLYGCFTSRADVRPYDPVPETIDLQAKNPETGALARRSERLDWSAYDRADPDELNAILWQALKPGRTQPAPVRSSAALDIRAR